jgi:hypothetical protein
LPEQTPPAFVLANPALQRFTASIAMRLVAYVGGLLIGANLLTTEQLEMIREYATSWVVGLIFAGGSMVYGLARSYIDRRKMLKAMALPFAVTEKELEQRIEVGGAPSIKTPKTEMPGPSTSPKTDGAEKPKD